MLFILLKSLLRFFRLKKALLRERKIKNETFFSILFHRMIRLWILALQLAELFVSSLVHLLYGFYIFSSAVAGDLSQALNEMFFKPNMNVEVKEVVPKETTTNVNDLPPIVLVHGIFGFGKGVRLFFPIFSQTGSVSSSISHHFGCSNCFYYVSLYWVLIFISLICRNWEVYHISQGQRKRTKGFSCLIWGL